MGDEGCIWGTTFENKVFMIKDGKKFDIDGDFKQVDAGNNRVVGVSLWGDIFFRTDVSIENA
jgi:hypothetical protein